MNFDKPEESSCLWKVIKNLSKKNRWATLILWYLSSFMSSLCDGKE